MHLHGFEAKKYQTSIQNNMDQLYTKKEKTRERLILQEILLKRECRI